MHLHCLSTELQTGSGGDCYRPPVHDLSSRSIQPSSHRQEIDSQPASGITEVRSKHEALITNTWGNLLHTTVLLICCLCNTNGFVFRHDQAGVYMASFSADDPVFIYDSRPSTKFAILGYIGKTSMILQS